MERPRQECGGHDACVLKLFFFTYFLEIIEDCLPSLELLFATMDVFGIKCLGDRDTTTGAVFLKYHLYFSPFRDAMFGKFTEDKLDMLHWFDQRICPYIVKGETPIFRSHGRRKCSSDTEVVATRRTMSIVRGMISLHDSCRCGSCMSHFFQWSVDFRRDGEFGHENSWKWLKVVESS